MRNSAISSGEPADDRDGFRFRGGHAALDLAATLTGRAKGAPRDLLERPEDLRRWLEAAGFECTVVEDGALETARSLREVIYDAAIARIAARPLPLETRESINAFARPPSAAPRLKAGPAVEILGTADALLAFVAREAVLLIGGDDGARVRQCQGEGCAILFLDTSRSQDRRWCSMAACGNRHKIAEYRRRKKQGG